MSYSCSIIIPHYGDPNILQNCLTALQKSSLLDTQQTIVIHSGPAPLPTDFKQHNSTVTFIETATRMYAGEARNHGAQLARSDCLLFVDADCIPSPTWAQSHVDAHQSEYEVTTGPVLPGPPEKPDGFAEYLIEFAVTRKPPFLSKPISAPACNFAISTDLFQQMQGFPNNKTGQDLLFNLRLRKQEYPLHFIPSASVYHCCRANRSTFLQHRDQIGSGLGEVTLQAEREGLFNESLSAEYQFLRVICRSPFGCLLIGAKLFRIALLIARGDLVLLHYVMRSPINLFWGLVREGVACRTTYKNQKNSKKGLIS